MSGAADMSGGGGSGFLGFSACGLEDLRSPFVSVPLMDSGRAIGKLKIIPENFANTEKSCKFAIPFGNERAN